MKGQKSKQACQSTFQNRNPVSAQLKDMEAKVATTDTFLSNQNITHHHRSINTLTATGHSRPRQLMLSTWPGTVVEHPQLSVRQSTC